MTGLEYQASSYYMILESQASYYLFNPKTLQYQTFCSQYVGSRDYMGTKVKLIPFTFNHKQVFNDVLKMMLMYDFCVKITWMHFGFFFFFSQFETELQKIKKNQLIKV